MSAHRKRLTGFLLLVKLRGTEVSPRGESVTLRTRLMQAPSGDSGVCFYAMAG